MESNKNMEQSGQAAAVPTEEKTEKKSESRRRESVNRDTQVIRTFLEGLSNYEADALRVCMAMGDERTTPENITTDDRLALNRYLNFSTTNERMTADNAQAHRISRASKLLERVAEFCDKRQLVNVNKALLPIAVDATDIGKAVASLDKRPAQAQPPSSNNAANK